jgi:hypothetical protein
MVKPVVAVVPFKVAISVALTAVVVPPAEAVNVTLDCPARTVTLEGTVTVALLLESATASPPAGAAPLMITVQVAVAGPVTVVGLQATEFTVIGVGTDTDIFPFDVVVGIDCPLAFVVDAPDRDRGIDVVADEEI